MIITLKTMKDFESIEPKNLGHSRTVLGHSRTFLGHFSKSVFGARKVISRREIAIKSEINDMPRW